MTNKTKQAYGTWPSAISAELITKAAPSLNCLQSHNNSLYWVEGRPWDAGRSVIMRRDGQGVISDLLPAPFSHSSKVHEYGGMAYAVDDSHLYFVNAVDQCIYKLALDEAQNPVAITKPGPRFAGIHRADVSCLVLELQQQSCKCSCSRRIISLARVATEFGGSDGRSARKIFEFNPGGHG